MRLPVRGTSPVRRETPSQAPHTASGASPAPAWRSDGLTTRTNPTTQNYSRIPSTPNSHPRRADSTATQPRRQESLITQVQRDQQPLLHQLPAEFLPPEPEAGTFTPLLPPKDKSFGRRHTLVLDLDETLVHSSFKPITLVDILLDIELDGNTHTVYVRKRPSVDKFLQRMCELFEVVVLTASLEVYADPVLDELDYDGFWVHHRLFRDSCANLNGNYIKDLSYLGRPLNKTIIIDNSPTSYLFQPRNALPISSWFDDPTDTELEELIPVLEKAAAAEDVYTVLDQYRQTLANGDKWC